jgi:hypothetical protein
MFGNAVALTLIFSNYICEGYNFKARLNSSNLTLFLNVAPVAFDDGDSCVVERTSVAVEQAACEEPFAKDGEEKFLVLITGCRTEREETADDEDTGLASIIASVTAEGAARDMFGRSTGTGFNRSCCCCAGTAGLFIWRDDKYAA